MIDMTLGIAHALLLPVVDTLLLTVLSKQTLVEY